MNNPGRIALRTLISLLLVVFVAGLISCGKREWPTPKLSEDRFRWRSLNVQRSGGCLVIDCEFAGAWQNLESMRVLLEPVGPQPGDGCPTCPFTPRTIRFVTLDSPAMRRDMNRFVITVCDLDPAKTYRLQVIASNVYPALAPVISELALSPPQ